ncbi:MAG: NUDIX domain-containing protein [Halioglobus sp.]
MTTSEIIETSETIEPVLPAATVVLLRDGDSGLEALLVQRSKAVKHMGGMWVFPGGKVDEADYQGAREAYSAALNAAIRETSEEVGLVIQSDQLVYQSHWTTPEGAKKRFATWFFLAILEDGQSVTVDGGEISNHRWVSPEQALWECSDDACDLRLMPPTYVSLCDIAQYEDCNQARMGIGARAAIVYAPNMAAVEGGMCFMYSGDAGYDSGLPDTHGPRHRCEMIDGKLDYISHGWT